MENDDDFEDDDDGEETNRLAEEAMQKTFTTGALFVSTIHAYIVDADKKLEELNIVSLPERWTEEECRSAMALMEVDKEDRESINELTQCLLEMFRADPAKEWTPMELSLALEDLSEEARNRLTYSVCDLIDEERSPELSPNYGVSQNMDPHTRMERKFNNLFNTEKLKERGRHQDIEWETERRVRHLFGVPDLWTGE